MRRGILLVSGVMALAVSAEQVRRLDHPDVARAGAWTAEVSADHGAYGSCVWCSDRAGAAMELAFIGTSVRLVHRTGKVQWSWGVIYEDSSSPLGLMEVWVDGKRQGEIDTSLGDGQTLLAKDLPFGEHVVRVVNLGRSTRKDAPGKVALAGFKIDADTDLQRRAQTVEGGRYWRYQAVRAVARNDQARVEGLAVASREVERLLSPLRRLQTEPPDCPMTRNERSYWKPDAATAAYLERLKGLGLPVRQTLDEAAHFQWDPNEKVSYRLLLDDIRRTSERCRDFFQAETLRLPPIAFTTGSPLRSGATPNAIWQSLPHDGRWGCSIRIIDPSRPQYAARVIFEEPDSIIFDLVPSFDATKLYFSMRRHRGPCWHIYEIGTDGKGLRQLTEGESHNVSPACLPSGKIAFISSRHRGTHTVCQSGPSTQLHVMDGDGGNVRRLSSNTLSDFYLSTLRDGRLLYTRWEYVDVNLTYRQSLWTQYPDGRQFALWFGNLTLDPASFSQAREIPGRYSVVAAFTSHHHTPRGAIGIISNRMGPEAPNGTGFRTITREFPAILDRDLFWGYCAPYPVTGSQFLVAYGGGGLNRFRIQLLDEMDNAVTVYEDPVTSCFNPVPLRPVPPPAAIPDQFVENPPTLTVEAAPPGQPERETVPLGRLMVSDVRQGFASALPDGEIRFIRIMEQLPKTMNRTWNFIMDQGPLMSASTYYAKRVWGYVPVEADGSAYFEAPALKEIYLQLCDAEGREVQRMTSAINLMPGETQSCVGCHENRQASGMPLTSKAAHRPPTPLKLPDGGNAGVLDYNVVVQPVFDRYCVKCHSGTNPPKGVSLTGHYTRFFNMSYDTLTTRFKSDKVSRAYYTGDSEQKPMVQSFHLLYGIMDPLKAKQSGSFASRLPDFLKKEHCKVDIPLADRRKVYEWIDAMIPYYPTSDYAHLRGKSNRDKWGDKDSTELLPWFTQRFNPLYEKSCASCHGPIRHDTYDPQQQWMWLDLTQAEWSPALTAHLPKAAGGRGLAAEKFAFSGKDDPVYKGMLEAIREGGRESLKTPEADMPGFVNRSKGFGEFKYK